MDIQQLIIDILRRSDPMGADPTGANPVGVEGANRSASDVLKYVPKDQFGRGADTTARINADLAGQPRPQEGMNGILRMLEAVDAASRR